MIFIIVIYCLCIKKLFSEILLKRSTFSTFFASIRHRKIWWNFQLLPFIEYFPKTYALHYQIFVLAEHLQLLWYMLGHLLIYLIQMTFYQGYFGKVQWLFNDFFSM